MLVLWLGRRSGGGWGPRMRASSLFVSCMRLSETVVIIHRPPYHLTTALSCILSCIVCPAHKHDHHHKHSFCEAMIKIRAEIADIEAGRVPKDNNTLVNAPHTASVVLAEQWDR